MVKQKRIKRSKADLVDELNVQIALLVNACLSFDNGLKPIGKHIALSLRTLLHHQGMNRALLEQLGLRSKRFMDTAGDLNPKNLMTECNLCAMRVGGGNTDFIPLCESGGGPMGARWLPFTEWWNQDVLKDEKKRKFNRRELILNVAETDGGAHVDPDLDEAYMDLSRNNSLAWMITEGDVERPFPSPTMPCMRQIAHEVLETLKVKAEGMAIVEYGHGDA